MGVNSLPKTVTRQRRDCDLNPGPTAPVSGTLNTRLPTTEPPQLLTVVFTKYCHIYVALLIMLCPVKFYDARFILSWKVTHCAEAKC